MAAAARRLNTQISGLRVSALRETARRAPWVNGFKIAGNSPVAELWARIEQEYAQAAPPAAASND